MPSNTCEMPTTNTRVSGPNAAEAPVAAGLGGGYGSSAFNNAAVATQTSANSMARTAMRDLGHGRDGSELEIDERIGFPRPGGQDGEGQEGIDQDYPQFSDKEE